MSPRVQKLIGQAVVRLINGDRGKAEELSVKAHKIWYREYHLHATIGEIINYKRETNTMGGFEYESK